MKVWEISKYSLLKAPFVSRRVGYNGASGQDLWKIFEVLGTYDGWTVLGNSWSSNS